MLNIGPYQQKTQRQFLRNRAKRYRTIYAFVFLAAVLVIALFLHGNYQLYYIQDDYYVYNDIKFRILPDYAEDDTPDLDVFDSDTIQPPPDKSAVDLRPYFNEIQNQGRQGACLAFAFSALAEYLWKTGHQQTADFSEAFLYYESRKLANDPYRDAGCRLAEMSVILLKEGVCLEHFMPYDEYDYTTPPTPVAMDNALHYRFQDIYYIDNDLDALRTALHNGYPIAVSLILFSSFGQGRDGFIPIPTKRERQNFQYAGHAHGLHAMVIVGYDDNQQRFIVRNSWGKDFGDAGYCYIPYDYITDSELCNFTCIVPAFKL